MKNPTDSPVLSEREAFGVSASQIRPHLATQVDWLVANPGAAAHEVPEGNSLNLSDRRFLVRVARLLA